MKKTIENKDHQDLELKNVIESVGKKIPEKLKNLSIKILAIIIFSAVPAKLLALEQQGLADDSSTNIENSDHKSSEDEVGNELKKVFEEFAIKRLKELLVSKIPRLEKCSTEQSVKTLLERIKVAVNDNNVTSESLDGLHEKAKEALAPHEGEKYNQANSKDKPGDASGDQPEMGLGGSEHEPVGQSPDIDGEQREYSDREKRVINIMESAGYIFNDKTESFYCFMVDTLYTKDGNEYNSPIKVIRSLSLFAGDNVNEEIKESYKRIGVEYDNKMVINTEKKQQTQAEKARFIKMVTEIMTQSGWEAYGEDLEHIEFYGITDADGNDIVYTIEQLINLSKEDILKLAKSHNIN